MAAHPLRVALIGLGALIVAAAAALGIFVATFNPNAYKPRIIAAIRAAAGREVTLNGPIALALLPPGVTLHDVALANPPGFAAPRMATLRAVTLRLDLGALLHRRLVVRRLTLDTPDITLERDAAGLPNWRFTPAPPATAAAPSQPGPPNRSARLAVLDAVVEGGTLTYRDDRTALALVLSVPHLTLHAAAPDAPAHISAQAAIGRIGLTLNADTGPLSGFATGVLPLRADLAVDGDDLHAAVAVTAPAIDQPMRVAATGTVRGTPFTASVELPRPALSLAAMSLQAQVQGALLSAHGGIAQPGRLAGVDLAVAVRISDLAALSALAGRPLPALHDLSVTARLTDRDGLRNGLQLHDLQLATPAGALAGTADLAFAPRLDVRADLSGPKLDLAALQVPPPASTPAPHPSPAVPPAPARAPPPPLPRRATGHLIPDTALPFAALRQADADIRLRVATLAAGGESLHDADAHLGLAEATLSLTAHASFAASPVDLTAIADARPATPVVALALNAPALPVAPLLAAFGQPAYATGTIALAANLHGAGPTAHLIATGLDGFAAASMNGGRIQTRLLDRALGPAMGRINPLGLLGSESPLRCLAVRASAVRGMATLAPLLLSSPLLTVAGTGRVDLAAETIDLHLQPQGRVGGVTFSVPMTVRGGLRDPHVAVTDAAAAANGLRAALGLLAGKGRGEAAPPGPSCPQALAAARS